jgi:hypothetical protein
MSNYIHRGILIVPNGRVAAANTAFEAIGWGPGNFSVKLTAAPGGGPVTNWALSGVFTEADKLMLIDAIDNDILPVVDWVEAGTTEIAVGNAFKQMTYAFTDTGGDALAQFVSELQGKTLTRVPDPEIV